MYRRCYRSGLRCAWDDFIRFQWIRLVWSDSLWKLTHSLRYPGKDGFRTRIPCRHRADLPGLMSMGPAEIDCG